MQLADVRTAAASDATTISRLLADAIRGSYDGILDEIAVRRLISTQCALPRIRAEIEIPGGAPGWLGWLVATAEDGTLVGAAAGGVPVPGEGELYALCVAEGSRRRGVGAALLSAAADRMRGFGARELRVTLPSERDPWLPFYEASGFTPLTPTRLTQAL
ncbi:GNAT family N-acetyltransferase [Streptomyces vilmorinianum]|uniref:GNAT family N-acetyltransferase n=1 Tax=Streptomyces vilmorinianum TaxID=3051092 RepID=UPI0010FB87C7|nr:GNAT family N-acetyltransferase [Streptomyces vilmorinianum]